MRFNKIALAVILLSGLAFGQQGNNAGMRPRMARAGFDILKDYLGLTQEQLEQLNTLRSSVRDELQPLRRDAAEKARALREAMKKDPIDSNLISSIRADIRALREKMEAKQGEIGTAARKVLTQEQLTKLDQLHEVLKLQAAARQAVALRLIEPPEGLGPMGGGPGMMMGPRRRGN
jgi:Spy/CpxP family protein refolding chaperone